MLTGTPLTFKGTSTYAIHIGQGVKADVTLAGVNLTGASTFEVLTNRTGAGEGTYCYLTIKDDTTNILKPASGYGAGLRCGKTSTLVIDDENPNIVAGGSKLNVNDIITPKKGKVGFDGATLNGTAVRADSSLDLLDSEKPGTLKAYARSQSAAIGGSAAEDSGTLIFNGGNIVAMGSCQTEGNLERTTDDGTDDGGAGIGAGNMANGTVIIFNGGNILAKAAFHGSGIGGGYCNGNYFSAANNVRNSNAIVNTKDGISSKSVAGDITINGGYIRSYGSGHGNAFGQACCGTNTKKTITVTGGTLLPWSTTSASYYDIGGAGGYVVITGGSIKLTGAVAGEPYTGNKFQSGEGNKAYNAPVGDPNRQQIFMFCIDLSKSDGVGTEPVASWDLEIGGKPYEYGAPSYFDAGKLYLWLPFSAVGKEITVKLKRYNEDGSLKPVEDLSATPGDSSGSGLGKRWISYELTDEFKTENASLFSKYYDGESIKNLIASLESYVGTDGLPAPYEANKDAKLTNPDALLYQSAKLGDDGKPLDEYYPTEAVHDHKVLPTDFEDGTGDVAFSVGDVPGGLVPVSGGIKLVLPDGSETTCPDDAYSPEKGDVVVFAGPVRGGQKVRLVIDALVTDAALGTDIGNVAFAYGTDPSGTETTVLTGDPSGTPGWRFEGIDGLEQAASEGTAFRSESKVTYPEGYDGQVRPNPAGDGDTKLKMRRLAKTGDEVPLALPLGLAMLAASALAVIALAARTNRRARG